MDEYLSLKGRVETRMRISVMTASGDDLINPEEKGDLEYRKAQLKRLQEEVVDIEDMQSGISIMDLGLNEFRLDLLEYVKSPAPILYGICGDERRSRLRSSLTQRAAPIRCYKFNYRSKRGKLH